MLMTQTKHTRQGAVEQGKGLSNTNQTPGNKAQGLLGKAQGTGAVEHKTSTRHRPGKARHTPSTRQAQALKPSTGLSNIKQAQALSSTRQAQTKGTGLSNKAQAKHVTLNPAQTKHGGLSNIKHRPLKPSKARTPRTRHTQAPGAVEHKGTGKHRRRAQGHTTDPGAVEYYARP